MIKRAENQGSQIAAFVSKMHGIFSRFTADTYFNALAFNYDVKKWILPPKF